jgi:hypothetical protein
MAHPPDYTGGIGAELVLFRACAARVGPFILCLVCFGSLFFHGLYKAYSVSQ